MKKYFPQTACLIIFLFVSKSLFAVPGTRSNTAMKQAPLSFIENKGQMAWPIPMPDSTTMNSLLSELTNESNGRRANGTNSGMAPVTNLNGLQAQFSVFPNPTYGSLTVNATMGGKFTLYTMLGQTLQEYAITKGQTNVLLPVNLAAGMYMGQFKPDDGGVTKEVRLVYQP